MRGGRAWGRSRRVREQRGGGARCHVAGRGARGVETGGAHPPPPCPGRLLAAESTHSKGAELQLFRGMHSGLWSSAPCICKYIPRQHHRCSYGALIYIPNPDHCNPTPSSLAVHVDSFARSCSTVRHHFQYLVLQFGPSRVVVQFEASHMSAQF